MAVTVYGSLGVSRLQAADPRQPQRPPVAEDLRGFGIGMSDRPRLLALVCSQDGAASLIAPIGRDGDVGIVNNIETSPENW